MLRRHRHRLPQMIQMMYVFFHVTVEITRYDPLIMVHWRGHHPPETSDKIPTPGVPLKYSVDNKPVVYLMKKDNRKPLLCTIYTLSVSVKSSDDYTTMWQKNVGYCL